MPDLIPVVDDAQRLVLETLYRVFRETRDWPRYQYVATVLDEHDLDLQRVLESMPPGLLQEAFELHKEGRYAAAIPLVPASVDPPAR